VRVRQAVAYNSGMQFFAPKPVALQHDLLYAILHFQVPPPSLSPGSLSPRALSLPGLSLSPRALSHPYETSRCLPAPLYHGVRNSFLAV